MAPLNADDIVAAIQKDAALVQSPEGQALLRIIEARLTGFPQVQALEARLDTIVPGWKTSEFWMTALLQLGAIGSWLGGVLPSKDAAIATVVAQVAYTLSRGLTKQGSAK